MLPTYNEAANLEGMARALLALTPPVAVVIVDDDSPDGTSDIAMRLSAADERVSAIRRTGARGLGTALIAGLQAARRLGFETVATMDCDFSHDPGALPGLLRKSAGADVVIGSRYVEGGRIPNWSLVRRVLSLAANWFVRLLFSLPVRDCTSGFRVYRGALLDQLPWQRICSSGYSFQVEVLVWTLRAPGTRVVELPIEFRERAGGKSKLGIREALNGLRHLPRLRRDIGRSPRRPE